MKIIITKKPMKRFLYGCKPLVLVTVLCLRQPRKWNLRHIRQESILFCTKCTNTQMHYNLLNHDSIKRKQNVENICVYMHACMYVCMYVCICNCMERERERERERLIMLAFGYLCHSRFWPTVHSSGRKVASLHSGE